MKLLCMIAVFLCIPWVASDAQKQDWGNLKRYAEANKELVRKGKQKDRVVFMGTTITEGWVANDAAFFEDNGYVGRGIGGRLLPISCSVFAKMSSSLLRRWS